jgi:hypothetical protein
VLKMSSISYGNAQPTIIYVRDTRVFLATPCLMVQPESEQLRLFSILIVVTQQDQLAHVVYTMTLFTREHCLSLPHGSHIAVTNVQQIVEEECGVD